MFEEKRKTFYQVGEVKYKTKSKKLSNSEKEDLTDKIPDAKTYFQTATKIQNCYIKGIFLESNSEKVKKSDNSIVKIGDIFGSIYKILILNNEVFLVLQRDYKAIAKKTFSQYYEVEKLEKSEFYVRNVKKIESTPCDCNFFRKWIIFRSVSKCHRM